MALKLASIQGWQFERRQALALLKDKMRRAEQSLRFASFFALCRAHDDVLDVLRERAASEIAEGVEMRWAHHTRPQQVAA
jgi:hypothetical protein